MNRIVRLHTRKALASRSKQSLYRLPSIPVFLRQSNVTSSRLLSTSLRRLYAEPASTSKEGKLEPDEISIEEYHRLADDTLEHIFDHLEELGETYGQIDSELSQGVLTLILPPNGTYVINKQPPNKQIWLSSPITGPVRYDLIHGKWVDHWTSDTLGDLLRKEVTEALGGQAIATFEGVD
ncbi:frataxin, mitochondrial precursor, partial [Lipomyces oligophaga]|uniref:frataxin, mitochondrial precursor n=1 Tax=Lipomyces oligophaga TaxID=45792 RepID=UPI0034CDFD84